MILLLFSFFIAVRIFICYKIVRFVGFTSPFLPAKILMICCWCVVVVVVMVIISNLLVVHFTQNIRPRLFLLSLLFQMEIRLYLPQLPRSAHSFIDSAWNITRRCSAYNTFSHCSRHSIFFIFILIIYFFVVWCVRLWYIQCCCLPKINLYKKKPSAKQFLSILCVCFIIIIFFLLWNCFVCTIAESIPNHD